VASAPEGGKKAKRKKSLSRCEQFEEEKKSKTRISASQGQTNSKGSRKNNVE
jgi:hypothetical protein